MNLPTREEIDALWDEYHVPQNVREHSQQVAKVAVLVAQKLKEKGIHVDVGLVERAALLHDMTRAANFENFEMQTGASEGDIEFWKQLSHKYGNVHHGESAADLLKEKYPEVAEVIRAHTIEFETENILDASWEMKILVYSDIRVVHDKILSMKERFEDSKKRHGNFFDKLKEQTGIDYRELIMSNLIKIEKQIFDIIDIEPEDIK